MLQMKSATRPNVAYIFDPYNLTKETIESGFMYGTTAGKLEGTVQVDLDETNPGLMQVLRDCENDDLRILSKAYPIGAVAMVKEMIPGYGGVGVFIHTIQTGE